MSTPSAQSKPVLAMVERADEQVYVPHNEKTPHNGGRRSPMKATIPEADLYRAYAVLTILMLSCGVVMTVYCSYEQRALPYTPTVVLRLFKSVPSGHQYVHKGLDLLSVEQQGYS